MASSRRYVPSQARWTRRSRPARCRLHRAQVGAHSARCRAHLAAARKRTLVVLKCKLRTSSENVPLTSGGPGPGRRLSPIAACRRAKESDLSKHPKITLHDAKMGTRERHSCTTKEALGTPLERRSGWRSVCQNEEGCSPPCVVERDASPAHRAAAPLSAGEGKARRRRLGTGPPRERRAGQGQMSDVRDILGVDGGAGGKGGKAGKGGAGAAAPKRPKPKARKPKGMSREAYALTGGALPPAVRQRSRERGCARGARRRSQAASARVVPTNQPTLGFATCFLPIPLPSGRGRANLLPPFGPRSSPSRFRSPARGSRSAARSSGGAIRGCGRSLPARRAPTGSN